MKKITILAIVLFALSAGSAFAAFSAGAADGSLTLGTSDTVVVKLSKNVEMEYQKETTGLGYAVGAYHTSGTRTFASSSGDSKIWYKDATGATVPNAPVGTASAAFSGWTAL